MWRLLTINAGALAASIGLIVVTGSGAFAQQSESARMLVALVFLASGALMVFSLFAIGLLWCSQRVVRRMYAHAGGSEREVGSP